MVVVVAGDDVLMLVDANGSFCIPDRDEWKAVFTMHCGAFEPLVMFFSLSNSLATFQTMMNAILWDLIDKGVVVVYIDNILIFTETEKGQ